MKNYRSVFEEFEALVESGKVFMEDEAYMGNVLQPPHTYFTEELRTLYYKHGLEDLGELYDRFDEMVTA